MFSTSCFFLGCQEPGSHDIEASAAPAKEAIRMKGRWNPVLGKGHHLKQAPSRRLYHVVWCHESMVVDFCSFGRSVGVGFKKRLMGTMFWQA